MSNVGCRFTIVSEPEAGKQFNMAEIKKMTGADAMSGRALYQNTMTFKPQWTLICVCNTIPDLSEKTPGALRRLDIKPFKARFGVDEHNKPVTTKEQERPEDEIYMADEPGFFSEGTLDTTLPKWRYAFFAMIASYYKEYRAKPQFTCEAVEQMKRSYLSETDHFAQFVGDELTKVDEAMLQIWNDTHPHEQRASAEKFKYGLSKIVIWFQQWCKTHGCKSPFRCERDLQKRIKQQFHTDNGGDGSMRKTNTGQTLIGWVRRYELEKAMGCSSTLDVGEGDQILDSDDE
jgi:phage/plasmid-associated DNA primase